MHDDRYREQQQNAQFETHQHAEQPAIQIDTADAGELHHRHAEQRIAVPGHGRVQERRKNHCAEKSKQPIQRDLDEGVRHQRDECAGHAQRPSESGGDVRVKGAGAHHMPAHRGEAHAENQQHDTGNHERARNARAITQADRRRHRTEHAGKGRCRGNHEEHDLPQAQRIALQFHRVLRVDQTGRRVGFIHRCLYFVG